VIDTPVFPGVPLEAADEELIAAARAVMLRHYRPFWHTVAAALRGRDGRVWTGVHLGATVGRLQVCAEAVALGRAILEATAASPWPSRCATPRRRKPSAKSPWCRPAAPAAR